jgi:hypothetical protein
MAGTAQATKLKLPRNLKSHYHFREGGYVIAFSLKQT